MSRDIARLRNFILQSVGMVFPSPLLLPQLRAAWYFSSVDAGGDLIDTSGHGKTLTNSGTVTFGVDDYLPYGILNGSSQFFNTADEAHFDITGALTIISIDYFDNTASAIEAMVSKNNVTGNERSYFMYRDSNGKAVMLVSSNGTAETIATSTTVIASGNWVFTAGRYDPSTELAIFLGFQGGDEGVLEKVVNTTSIPASINNSTAQFALGATQSGGPASHMAGRKAMTFICATNLSDNFINMVYSQVRTILGV